ncbi:MAG TPA: SRPBCC family protein [Ktedonobacterales bacterium]|nr:SRPBCC family protein [Ktedonobacterales bacterium]
MRIEGTYLFPAPMACIFDALLDPALLKRIIPNGERLIQLGPPDASGVSYEARIRLPEGPGFVHWHVLPVRRPAGRRLTLRGRLPAGAFAGRGTVDLVERDTHTRAAYTLDLDLPASAAADAAAGVRAAIVELCERLAAALHEVTAADAEIPSLSPGDGVRMVKTRHGRIVALSAAGADATWGERALWLSAGLALGVVAISLALALAHRFNGHDT